MPEFHFDSSQHEADQRGGFDPVPPGWYPVMITESSFHQNSAGTGHYLKLRLDIVGPDYNGRVVFHNLNIDNPNEKTVQIANGQLSSICQAIGVLAFNATEELHGKPFQAKVKIDPPNDAYPEPSNKCTGFKAVEDAASPVAVPPKQSAAPGAAAAAATAQAAPKPPWQK